MRFAARRLTLLGLLLVLLLAPGTAAAWWNGEWAYRMRIVVGGPAQADGNAGGPAGAAAQPVGRTPVLIRLHQGIFNFNTAKEDGTDLRFVAGDERTALRFHVERYDSLVDQVGLFWVDVPDLVIGGEGTPVWLYWGNKNAPPAGEARAVYDTDTVVVYNFADDAAAPRDATGFANHAATGARRDDGLVGFGQRFDGTATVRFPATPSPSLGWGAGGPVTWSMWVRPDPTPEGAVGSGVLYQAGEGALRFTIGLAAGIPYVELATDGGVARAAGTAPIPPESWRHLAVAAGPDRLGLFVDGQPAAELPVVLPAMTGTAALGGPLPAEPLPVVNPAAPPVAAVPGFTGVIDVFRIEKAARAPIRFVTAFRGEGPAASLLRFDVAEEGSIFGTGHFGIIANNLTLDAWIVIGICAALAPFTWLLFGMKTAYIAGLSGGNKRFRATFRAAAAKAGTRGFAGIEGLTTPAAAQRFRKSSLYRFYVIALEELDVRGGIHRAGNLSAPSLAAIRAAVDSAYTAETLRLGAGLVVLTIAISGGPFIGLLGTVLGVMITFAAVAAAGDVNVNAIAPGIAAALAATVAGLAVAIPALFGYNYLTVRIKDVSADMRGFVDELVTRIGEGATGGTMEPYPMLKAAE